MSKLNPWILCVYRNRRALLRKLATVVKRIPMAHALNLFLALTTAILAYFTFLLWQETRATATETKLATEIARQALDSNRRAWIVPLGARFKSPPSRTKPVEIEVAYENEGNEPAVVSNSYQPVQLTDAVDGGTDRVTRQTIVNETCRKAQPAGQGLVVYPKQSRVYTNVSLLPPNFLTAEILRGTSVLHVRGCINYETLGAIHRSTYCFYLRSLEDKDIREWLFYACGSGNFAD